MSNKIVFLDRDGTINEEVGYVSDPKQLVLIPGVADTISKLRLLGFHIVIVTNQGHISKGMATVDQVKEVNRSLQNMLIHENPSALIDLVLFSKFSSALNTLCTKPNIGMVLGNGEADRDFSEIFDRNKGVLYDKTTSIMVGDKLSDIDFGLNLGLDPVNCYLVMTGHGQKTLGTLEADRKYDFIKKIKSLNDILSYLDK